METQRALLQAKLDAVTVDGAVLSHTRDGASLFFGPIDAAFVVRMSPVIAGSGQVAEWSSWVNLQLGDLDGDQLHVVRVVRYDDEPGLSVTLYGENGDVIEITRHMPEVDPPVITRQLSAWAKTKLDEPELYQAARDRQIDAAADMAEDWRSATWGA